MQEENRREALLNHFKTTSKKEEKRKENLQKSGKKSFLKQKQELPTTLNAIFVQDTVSEALW